MPEYGLNFFEAIEECLLKNNFIRGEDFEPGTYAKNRNGTIVLMDGKSEPHIIYDNLLITEGLFNQKFKTFSIADKKNLNLE